MCFQLETYISHIGTYLCQNLSVMYSKRWVSTATTVTGENQSGWKVSDGRVAGTDADCCWRPQGHPWSTHVHDGFAMRLVSQLANPKPVVSGRVAASVSLSSRPCSWRCHGSAVSSPPLEACCHRLPAWSVLHWRLWKQMFQSKSNSTTLHSDSAPRFKGSRQQENRYARL